MSELRWCGYCESWHNKPCGDGCYWRPTGQTLDQMKAGLERAKAALALSPSNEVVGTVGVRDE